MKKIEEQALALAGVFQTAVLVEGLADRGQADASASINSLSTIYKLSAETTLEIFGETSNLRIGLRTLHEQLAQPDREKMNITGYALGLVQLAGKLLKDNKRMQQLQDGIEKASEKLDLYEIGHVNQDAMLADLYSNIISNLSPRIMVKGQPIHLQNPDIQRRIRALLLAGIRSAVLWRQLGGNRFQLIFRRKQLLAEVEQLIQRA